MCVIAVSKKGVGQPDADTLGTMFRNNPHGAGFMWSSGDAVHIRKGFMRENDFLDAVAEQNFGDDDIVVYHCRIATQGGVKPALCHPFPLRLNPDEMMETEDECMIGVAHNGVIHQHGCDSKKYSDSQLFIAEYLSWIMDEPDAIHDRGNRQLISELTLGSRLAILDRSGNLMLTGRWVQDTDGNIYSNESFLPRTFCFGR